MNIFQSGQNNYSRSEIGRQDDLQKGINNLEENPLEMEYPFTLDLIYHRRQPRAAALISLLVPGFGGLGQLLLGQETKAGLLLVIEWFIVMPIGFFAKILPYLLLFFHLLTAIDAWVLSERLQKRQTLKEWEWFWKNPLIQ